MGLFDWKDEKRKTDAEKAQGLMSVTVHVEPMDIILEESPLDLVRQSRVGVDVFHYAFLRFVLSRLLAKDEWREISDEEKNEDRRCAQVGEAVVEEALRVLEILSASRVREKDWLVEAYSRNNGSPYSVRLGLNRYIPAPYIEIRQAKWGEEEKKKNENKQRRRK